MIKIGPNFKNLSIGHRKGKSFVNGFLSFKLSGNSKRRKVVVPLVTAWLNKKGASMGKCANLACIFLVLQVPASNEKQTTYCDGTAKCLSYL